MDYRIDQSYEFEVIDGRKPSDDSFVIRYTDANGEEQTSKLYKIPFQRTPTFSDVATVNCRVKNIDANGRLGLTFNIAHYVNLLYSGLYARGEAFEGEVLNVPKNPREEPYTIVDRNGIFFRYNDPDGVLARGQKLMFTFGRLTPQFFTLKRVQQSSRLQFFTLDAILDGADVQPEYRRRISAMVERMPEFAQARKERDSGNAIWPLTAARTVADMLPAWFLSPKLGKHHLYYDRMLSAYRRCLLFLLEGSNYLLTVHMEQRRAYQQQLTDMADAIEPYRNTLDLMARGQVDSYVEGILDKLQQSGYIYHPARRFAAMMLIFRLYPDKVGDYLMRIFESIFSRDLDNWTREPFRSAFLEQFEIYVRQSRGDIDMLPIAESSDAKKRVETVITAIALQLLLADKDADLSAVWSLFYRYIAIMRPLNGEQLLSKSFLALMGADINSRLKYDDLKQPMMMMTQAIAMPAGNILDRIEGTHRFTGRGVELKISADGISLRPEGRADITERAMADGFMPWLQPQIYVNGVRPLSGAKLRKLADHSQWWNSIESRLFEDSIHAQAQSDDEGKAVVPAVGDEVYIVIDSVVNENEAKPVFRCHVADSGYERVDGTIGLADIVGYKLPHPSPQAWRTDAGDERGFLATVIADDPATGYRFSLDSMVRNYVADNYNCIDHHVAKIKSAGGADYSAVSDLGVGLFIERTPDTPPLKEGDMIYFRFSKLVPTDNFKGTFVDMADTVFTDNEAFVRLMTEIGEVDDSEDDDLDMVRDIDELISADSVREIIEIFRFRAIGDNDLIKAYDYLRFAKLLAMITGDERLTQRVATHAAMLAQHQFFATNSRLDADNLAPLAAAVGDDQLLQSLYRRLEMVSWLGQPEHNSELYFAAGEGNLELEHSIARMVLAYNMLTAADSATDSDNPAEGIKRSIMKRLNVNGETQRGKYYGSESKYLEFKTSLVYVAGAPGEEMRENPSEQTYHILTRIVGFLNANGGRLCLGVNNNGYEVGMHDDFAYYRTHPMYVGTYQHRIKDIDGLCVFIENLVKEKFGSRVARKITVSADDEAEKGVVIIDVEQSLEPVEIDGHLFVRQSGQSTFEYTGDDKEDFRREREELMAEQRMRLRLEQQAAESAENSEYTDSADHSDRSAPVESSPIAEKSESAPSQSSPLSTSLWHPNVLHSDDADYSVPSGYLYFKDNDTIVLSERDKYYDYDPDCRLALVIPQEIASTGYLVLGYPGEKVCRIPLTEIISRGDNAVIPVWADEPLMFAALADRADMLLCIVADSNDGIYRRTVKVADIAQVHPGNAPVRFHGANVNHTVAYDIVDSRAASRFSDSDNDRLGNKRVGVTLRTKETLPDGPAAIEKARLEGAPETF